MTSAVSSAFALFKAGRGRLTVGVCLVMSLVAFELLGAATALPAALDDVGGLNLYGWALAAPLFAGALTVPIGGRLADRGGLGLPMVAALLLFGLGLIGAALSQSMGAIALARFVQGAGSGMLLALQLAIVARGYPGALRGSMLALLSSVWIVPGLVGPALAGLVAEHLGWRWVFAGVVPLILVTAALVLPALPPRAEIASHASKGETWWHSPGLRAAVATGLLISLGFLSAEAFLPLVLTRVEDFSFAAAGLPLTVSSVTWALGAWVQARNGPERWRSTAATGALLIGVGIAATASVLLDVVPGWISYGTWGVAAFGMGLAFTIVQHAAIDTAPAGREATAGATVELANLLGVAAGTGVAGVLIGRTSGDLEPAFALMFAICALATVAAAVTARRLPCATTERPAVSAATDAA